MQPAGTRAAAAQPLCWHWPCACPLPLLAALAHHMRSEGCAARTAQLQYPRPGPSAANRHEAKPGQVKPESKRYCSACMSHSAACRQNAACCLHTHLEIRCKHDPAPLLPCCLTQGSNCAAGRCLHKAISVQHTPAQPLHHLPYLTPRPWLMCCCWCSAGHASCWTRCGPRGGLPADLALPWCLLCSRQQPVGVAGEGPASDDAHLGGKHAMSARYERHVWRVRASKPVGSWIHDSVPWAWGPKAWVEACSPCRPGRA